MIYLWTKKQTAEAIGDLQFCYNATTDANTNAAFGVSEWEADAELYY